MAARRCDLLLTWKTSYFVRRASRVVLFFVAAVFAPASREILLSCVAPPVMRVFSTHGRPYRTCASCVCLWKGKRKRQQLSETAQRPKWARPLWSNMWVVQTALETSRSWAKQRSQSQDHITKLVLLFFLWTFWWTWITFSTSFILFLFIRSKSRGILAVNHHWVVFYGQKIQCTSTSECFISSIPPLLLSLPINWTL